MAFNSREGQLFLLLEGETVSGPSWDIPIECLVAIGISKIVLLLCFVEKRGEIKKRKLDCQDRQRSARHGDRVHEVRFRGESRDSREGERRRRTEAPSQEVRGQERCHHNLPGEVIHSEDSVNTSLALVN